MASGGPSIAHSMTSPDDGGDAGDDDDAPTAFPAAPASRDAEDAGPCVMGPFDAAPLPIVTPLEEPQSLESLKSE